MRIEDRAIKNAVLAEKYYMALKHVIWKVEGMSFNESSIDRSVDELASMVLDLKKTIGEFP